MEGTLNYTVYSMSEDFRGEVPKPNGNIRLVCPKHGLFVTKWYLAVKGGSRCPVCFPGTKVHEYGSKEWCIEDASGYKTRTEWQKKSKTAYFFAYRDKWVDECCAHMVSSQKPHGYWNMGRCKQDASNYNTRTEWQKNSGAYKAAHVNKWVDECCSHMTKLRKSKGYWTKRKCRQDALNYNTKSEWFEKSCAAYTAAHRNKWLVECCVHMVSGRTKRKPTTEK